MVLLSKMNRSLFVELQQFPNVGPATAGCFGIVGISQPSQLTGREPYALFETLCRTTGRRFDPCLLDQFIAVVRFMDGGDARPWWEFTAERKVGLKIRSTNQKVAQ